MNTLAEAATCHSAAYGSWLPHYAIASHCQPASYGCITLHYGTNQPDGYAEGYYAAGWLAGYAMADRYAAEALRCCAGRLIRFSATDRPIALPDYAD